MANTSNKSHQSTKIMKNLQEAAVELLAQKKYDERIARLLQQIATEPAENLVFKREALLDALHIHKISDIKTQTIGVILDYALLALQDGILTENELKNMALLKAFFKIKEGDFYKLGREQATSDILTEQLEKLYADHKIDEQEALMKVDLQELFGLTYDQFRKIVNKIAQKSIAQGADINNLDTFLNRQSNK